MKRRGIFIKVFTYTTIFIVLIVCITVVLFSQQFLSFYNTAQLQQLNRSYQSLYSLLHGSTNDEIAIAARSFFEANQSFSFYIKDKEEKVIFSTPDIDPGIIPDTNNFRIIMAIEQEYVLCATNQGVAKTDYSSLISKSLLALGCMLALGVAGAFIFARQMTKPIKRLADDTGKMANCEDVPPAPDRTDELGDLARGVHSMYEKLKDTISRLEDEILREREMEETQRYFFSAASHELKTPIAATSVMLEGMLENVGDYSNHPKYLIECIKAMDAQAKMITEILEIVSLNDSKITPSPEELDIKHTVANLLPNFQTLAEAGGKRITCNIPEGEITLADEKMLNKAISNVILNAVQNTPEGGGIRIWTEQAADHYRLLILNEGSIDVISLPKLFDPFYRTDKARNRKDGRSGLGLTIVQKALETMNICFSLENSSDGVLFRIDLPIV